MRQPRSVAVPLALAAACCGCGLRHEAATAPPPAVQRPAETKSAAVAGQPADRGTGAGPTTVRAESLRVQPGQEASVAVALDEPGTYVVQVFTNDDGCDPTVAVRDAHDQPLGDNDDFRNVHFAAVPVTVTKATPVTVAVGCVEDKGGEVALRVQRVGWPKPGEPITGRLETYEQWDWCCLRAKQGALYRITAEGSDGLDPLLVVCEGADELHTLCESDDITRDNLNASCVWACPRTGVYALGVTAADPRRLGVYTLGIETVVEAQ